MVPQPAAFLFDLDGLLLDTEPIHGQAWSTAARHFGLELTQAQLMQLRGRRRQDCAEQVDEWLPRSVGVEALLAIQQPSARAQLPMAEAMPGAEALVRYGHQHGIPMALVTSSVTDAVEFKAAPHPWIALIQSRVYGDDPELQRGKPHPDPFVLAARRLGFPTSECWAFEDSSAGTQSALTAGCQVWVLNRSASEQLTGNPRRIQSLETPIGFVLSTDD